MAAELSIAVLISGAGTNLQAICRAIDEKRCAARVVAVISDVPAAKGLGIARERGLPTAVVCLKDYPERRAWDQGLADAVAGFRPDLVVLAGFMRVVGSALLERFGGRVINIHPALLPLFPGTDGPGLALAAGVRLSGTTVHVVDAGVDTGPILAQAAVRVLPGDDRESLHRRIQRAEHRLLPEVIDRIARGSIELSPVPRIARPEGEDTEVFFSLPIEL